MNITDFSRRFKDSAGCPLFEFINRQRISRACALLKSSGMSIIEIAEAVGYNNLSFFNRYFLRIIGLSPRAYRSSPNNAR
jgi:AraC-like DNA-binding protein